MTNKLIIKFADGVKPLEALLAVGTVIQQGKISEAGGVKHYCWHTLLVNGLSVWVSRKRLGQTSDSFRVERYSNV